MKKVVMYLFVLSFFLVGCAKEDEGYDPFGSTAEERAKTEKESSSESSTKVSSSEKEAIDFYVRSPSYNNNKKTATILGKTNTGDNVTVTENGNELASTLAENDEFSIKIDLPDSDIEITVSNGKDKKRFKLLSIARLESSENEINEKYSGKDSSTVIEPSSTSEEPVTKSSSSTSQNKEIDQIEITSPSKDQKDLVVAWTQLDCEDRGIDLTYQGKDKWNVNINYIDGINKWIITTNDKNFGRVKAIYEWDGENDSGAKLVYLLVSGDELLNLM